MYTMYTYMYACIHVYIVVVFSFYVFAIIVLGTLCSGQQYHPHEGNPILDAAAGIRSEEKLKERDL